MSDIENWEELCWRGICMQCRAGQWRDCGSNIFPISTIVFMHILNYILSHFESYCNEFEIYFGDFQIYISCACNAKQGIGEVQDPIFFQF